MLLSNQNPIFLPGPTNIPHSLRQEVDYPSIDHRSSAFSEMFSPIRTGVKRILKQEDGEVIIFPATGTGAWETAISNTLSPGDKVLAARHGMFSHRWIDLCQHLGLEVKIIEVSWSEASPSADYQRILEADTNHEIKAVLATHNETATGVRSDIEAIRKAIDINHHPALFMVDGVSSIGSMDFRMQEWKVDIAVTGSQKGFMLPSGLAIIGFSNKALEAVRTSKNKRCYFDVEMMLEANSANSYPYTPPVSLLKGLAKSIQMLEEEGLENVFIRHYQIAEGVRKAISAWNLSLCANKPSSYSDTVSAILVPEGKCGTKVVTHAADKYGVAYGVGLGAVAGKVFRIGHLGSMTDAMALSGIAVAEMTMADLGFDISLGAGVSAAAEYYRNIEFNRH